MRAAVTCLSSFDHRYKETKIFPSGNLGNSAKMELHLTLLFFLHPLQRLERHGFGEINLRMAFCSSIQLSLFFIFIDSCHNAKKVYS